MMANQAGQAAANARGNAIDGIKTGLAAAQAATGIGQMSLIQRYGNSFGEWKKAIEAAGQVYEGIAPEAFANLNRAYKALEEGAAAGFSGVYARAGMVNDAATAVGAAFSAYDLYTGIKSGDVGAQIGASFELSSAALGTWGGPIGKAFDIGAAVGGMAAPIIDSTKAGSTAFMWIGEKIVNGLGIPVDRGATK